MIRAAASPERRAEIVPLLVARVIANKTAGVVGLEWTLPAAPFLQAGSVVSEPCGIRTHDTRIKSPLL